MKKKSWLKRAAGILFTDGRSILLLKKAKNGDNAGTWGLPGGKSNEGETEIDNAVRETKEETGIPSIPGYRFDSMTTKNGGKKFTTFFYRVPDSFDVKLSKEHSDFEWVKFEDLNSKNLHPKLKSNIAECLHVIKKKTSTFSEWMIIRETIKSLLA
jgi:mutator protein MutT